MPRDFPPPPCDHRDDHWMIPVTDPYTGTKTWRCTSCPAVRHLGNPTIHPQEPTP